MPIKCPQCGKSCKNQKGLNTHLRAHDPTIRMGRKPKPIDVKQLEKLALIHCTTREIGYFFGVDHKTIINRFSPIIAKSRLLGNIALRRAQCDKAMSGDITMLIWLGKNYLGQANKTKSSNLHKVEFGDIVIQ